MRLRPLNPLLLGLCGLFVLYVSLLLAVPGSPAAKWLYNVALVGAAFVCWKSPHLRGEERAAWMCLGTTLVLWAAGDFYYTLFLWDTQALPPTVTDWFWLASYPFLYAAIALLIRARTPHFERSLGLDAVLAALATAALGATLLFGTVVESTGGSPRMVAMNLAYPLADALLLGLVVAVLALSGWRIDRTWLFVIAGTAVLALADGAYLYEAATGSLGQSTLLNAGWPLAMLLLAAAAWQPVRRLGAVHVEGVRLLAVPAVFGLLSLAILVYAAFEPVNGLGIGLAATSALAVIARMGFTYREKLALLAASREEALTDALTGIGNRRKLLADLDEKLRSGAPTVLMLLDLNGFKAYNDTFGHPAGDGLLSRLAHKLAAAVEDGEGYRIGGDEFCVLAAAEPDRVAPLATAAAAALEERGDGFRVSAEYGLVMLPREAREASEALRLVDARMYNKKDSRRASAVQQSRDVLLRALYERDARLNGRLPELVELVRAVGAWLGLPPEAQADLALAAELHEVGKLAIPDSILHKDAALTEEERQFLHRHPLIAERILSSAPVLAKVSRVVRSVNERLDGQGYPDGLAGDAIPLHSRVIGACAAYISLTGRAAANSELGTPEALDELRRQAGTAFDGEIVEALAAVVGAPEESARRAVA